MLYGVKIVFGIGVVVPIERALDRQDRSPEDKIIPQFDTKLRALLDDISDTMTNNKKDDF